MTVLELLAAAARTRVVTAGSLLHADGFTYLLTGVAGGSRTLVRVTQVTVAVLAVLAALLTVLGRCLAYALRIRLRNLSTHQYGDCLVIHLVHHVVKQCDGFQLEYEQRILLFIAGILHGMFQLIQLTEILLPAVINGV